MNGAKTEERNYYAESYIALIEEIINETASLIKDIKKAMSEVWKWKNEKQELIETLGFKDEDIILTSGKTGYGVDKLLDSVIERIPSPKGNINSSLKALIFDSVFDP